MTVCFESVGMRSIMYVMEGTGKRAKPITPTWSEHFILIFVFFQVQF